tara:strand:+ start:583 stop:798 length:216 start_codon:yes stop_codon:yes gene_type:complete
VSKEQGNPGSLNTKEGGEVEDSCGGKAGGDAEESREVENGQEIRVVRRERPRHTLPSRRPGFVLAIMIWVR